MADESFFDEKQDRETLTRLSSAVEVAYNRTGLLMWRAFWQGFSQAIGALVASGLVILLVIFLFLHFGGVGLIQSWIHSFTNSIISSQEQSIQQISH